MHQFTSTIYDNKPVIYEDPSSSIYEEISSVNGDASHTYETLRELSLKYPDDESLKMNACKNQDHKMTHAQHNTTMSYEPEIKIEKTVNSKYVGEKIENKINERPPPAPPAPPLPQTCIAAPNQILNRNGYRY